MKDVTLLQTINPKTNRTLFKDESSKKCFEVMPLAIGGFRVFFFDEGKEAQQVDITTVEDIVFYMKTTLIGSRGMLIIKPAVIASFTSNHKGV